MPDDDITQTEGAEADGERSMNIQIPPATPPESVSHEERMNDGNKAVETVVDAETALSEQKQDENRASTPERTRVPGRNGGTILSPVRTSAQAREMVEKRWERWRRAAERGMTIGALTKDDEKLTLTKRAAITAYTEIVRYQAEKAMQCDDKGRPNTPAARFVREAIGADVGSPTQNRADNGTGITVTLSVAPEVAAALAERLVMLLSKE